MRYLLVGWLLLGAGPWRPAAATAPPDTLRLSYAEYDPAARFFSYCFDAAAQPPAPERAAHLWAAGRFRRLPRQDLLQAGYQPGRLWLRVAARNTLPQRTHFVWNLYSFADSAVLYVQPGGRGPLRRVGGASSWAVAARRPFPARVVCLPFWLAGGGRAVYYLRVENQAANWLLFTDITTTEGLLRYEQNYLGLTYWAWLLGLYVSSVLLNLLLYAFLRDRILLWYAAYVVGMTWFLLMEDSLDAVLLPPAVYGAGWRLGQFGVLLLAQACGLRILALFIRLRQGWPRLHLANRWLSNGALAYGLAYPLLVVLARPLGAAALLALLAGRTGLLWGLLLFGAGTLVAVGWRGCSAAQRRLAALYGAAYLLFTWGTVELMLNYSGLVYVDFIKPNSLAWCLVAELLMLSALLTGRFRRALRQAADQRLRRLREQAAASQRLIEAQDEERAALARELHDALAPGLTALHLAWQGRLVRQALREAPPLLAEAHAHTEALLRELRREVRTLSQALLPLPASEQPPLPEALALLVGALSLASDGPRIECACETEAAEVPLATQQAAYRIVAELLHNALRHAHARQVRVEVRRLPATLRLSVADDGRGFDPHGPPPRSGGLGLRGVRARASYLRGQVLVSSQPGAGTAIVVELPA